MKVFLIAVFLYCMFIFGVAMFIRLPWLAIAVMFLPFWLFVHVIHTLDHEGEAEESHKEPPL